MMAKIGNINKLNNNEGIVISYKNTDKPDGALVGFDKLKQAEVVSAWRTSKQPRKMAWMKLTKTHQDLIFQKLLLWHRSSEQNLPH